MENARARFARLARSPDSDLNLALGASLIAAEEYPGLDVDAVVSTFELYADDLKPRMRATPDARTRLRLLIDYLHEERGFAGDLTSYYDPRNSFLNEVLTRRLGIPISLAVVYLETARRVGVPLSGVSFPGHFLLRFGDETPVFIDPFSPRDYLTTDDCKNLLRWMSSDAMTFDAHYLEAATPRQILMRMLRNLKLIYLQQDDYDRAISAIDRILLLAPNEMSEYRDRGIAYAKMDAYLLALPDLARYLDEVPKAHDRATIVAALEFVRERVDELN